MKVKLNNLTVREVLDGYVDSQDDGVVAYGGKLNVRPKYQREFVYKDDQRDAVIKTVKNGFPLNVMYWAVSKGNKFELLDGQQRTISIGQYLNGDYSINGLYFDNLSAEEKDKIYNYELMIYFCEGTNEEKLDWFRTVNIAGVTLTDQELRNAVYTGPWLSDAKEKFSKLNCVAYLLANEKGKLLEKSPIRQEYLETALSWISKGKINDYMGKHQNDSNADELWSYFKNLVSWVNTTFPVYRSEMAKVRWGELYNQYKCAKLNPLKLEARISELMSDISLTNLHGIYHYVLTNQEKYLSVRSFPANIRRAAYEKQRGYCVRCTGKNKKIKWRYEEMEADHITPWNEGGKTVFENCQMLCKDCNRRKGGQ